MAIQLIIDRSGGADFEGYHLRNVQTLHVGAPSLAAYTLEVTGSLGVSGVSYTSGIAGAVSTVTGNNIITVNSETLFASGTLYLPSASSGGRISIKSVNGVTIFPQAGDSVENQGFLVLAANAAVELRADGHNNWGIFMAYLPDPDTKQLMHRLIGAVLYQTDLIKRINNIVEPQPVLEIRAVTENKG